MKGDDTMLTTPMDILAQFPIRRSNAQKQAFRDAVQSYAESLGYTCTVESGSYGVRNLVIGDPRTAKYLVTAHYDTCARMPVPNLLMPDNPLLYILYQLGFNLLAILTAIVFGVVGAFATALVYIACNEYPDAMIVVGLFMAACVVFFILAAVVLQFLLVWGSANRNNANDNTSGVVALLEILRTLPENQRHKVCFVLFDLNEAGLLGSRVYKKEHRETISTQLVLDLSCVGDGDHLLMIPTRELKQDVKKYKSVFKCCGYFGNKSLLVMDKGTSLIPSDHKRFPYGVCFMACRKGKMGHYISRIHTSKDTILDQTNVNILRAALTTLICGTAAQ